MIVVTGGAGFIGSNIIHCINQENRSDVVIIDRLDDDQKNNKWHNLMGLLFDNIIYPEQICNFLNTEQPSSFLEKNIDQIETIIHMGAISSTTEDKADYVFRNNFLLSRYLWTWCAKHKKRFIYASSAATYGNGEHGFEDAQDFEYYFSLKPLNLYGWTKHQFDLWVLTQIRNKLPTPSQWVGLKFFNVYGPREAHKGTMMSLASKYLNLIQKDSVIPLFKSYHSNYKDGEQLRDFVYVTDCAKIVTWFADFQNRNISGIFNVGTGKANSFKNLITSLGEALNKTPNIKFIDMPNNLKKQYQYYTQAEITNLRDVGCQIEFSDVTHGTKQMVSSILNQ